jgi:threonine synthase
VADGVVWVSIDPIGHSSTVQGSRQWRGVIHEYADRLDVSKNTPVVTLGEGGTPLIEAHRPLGDDGTACVHQV